MPTNREVIEFEGDYRLACAIQKNGGYEYWANRLGLEQAHSDTKVGIQGEKDIANWLIQKGFKVEPTSVKHPFDLLVNGCVKVDVKTSNLSYVRGYPIHSYRLAKSIPTCDFYIFYEADTQRIYIVPSYKLVGQVQVGMGIDSSLYQPYLEAYQLLSKASDMYKSM